MSSTAKYVIVAALEREISGLVRGWQRVQVGNLKAWRQGETVAVTVGMGWEKAFAGTNVVIETFRPELVTSIGFSGSLSTELPVGSIVVPAQVVGFKTGIAFEAAYGAGVLVTAAGVVGANDKAEMGSRFGALAVDMEAAGVAEAATVARVKFAAIKSISDGVSDEMDFVGAFVTPEGFKTGAFLMHVAFRPRLWKALKQLAQNTQKASEALTAALRDFTAEPEAFLARYSNQSTLGSLASEAQSARK